MDKENNKEILDFFMEDSPWLKPKNFKHKDQKKPEEKIVISSQKAEKREDKEQVTEVIEKTKTIPEVQKRKEYDYKEQEVIDSEDSGFGEVDYAILKSVTYGFKTIPEIAKALQIRNVVVEKHIYKLIKDGFIKYFQFCSITTKGMNEVENFEKNNSEDIWKPIDEFIVIVIEKRKERNIQIQKTIDLVLAVSVIILIILIIYFGII